MNPASAEVSLQRPRLINAVPLQNAVLCAECDVVSDSPHDRCLVCGSSSLFNIASIFGGNLPRQRATLITHESEEVLARDVVLSFPKHRLRRKTTVAAKLPETLWASEIDETQAQEIEQRVFLAKPANR